MICYVCDKEDWKAITAHVDGKDVPVHTQGKVQVCKNCGNLCHEVPADPRREEKIKEYYRKEYRPAPNISNLITTTHKQNYVQVFLRDFLQANRRQMKVADVGCATGYLLGWFKQMGHLVAGCEYTIPYRRMAEHYYGVPVTEELETKHRYDLISIYHVLEHMVEPDKKLAHYVSLLAEGGHMMISTPRWLGPLEDASGQPVKSFDYLYHKDHINLFSQASLNNLFRKCGLFVVKQEHEQYGQTYLLRKAKPGELPSDWMVKENWVDVEREVLRDRRAIEHFAAGRFKDALDTKPAFAEAWIAMIFAKNAKDSTRQAELFAEAEGHLPENKRLVTAKGQWYMMQGRLKEALEAFSKCVRLRPNEDIFFQMGQAAAQLGMVPEAVGYFEQAQAMDPRKWAECQTWILKLVCGQPAWDERLMAQAQQLLLSKAVESGEIKPPVLENALTGTPQPAAEAK